MGRLALTLLGIVALSCGGSTPGPVVATPAATPAAVATAPATPSPVETTVASASPKALWGPTQAPDYPCGAGVLPGSCAPKGIEWVALETGAARPIIAAVLRPAQSVAGPVVIYLHSDEGLLARDVDFAASLAKDGALVLVPCWQGPIGRASPRNIGCTAGAPLRSSATDVVKDVSAIADAARTLPGARADRVVVIGHSGGGIAALLTASMGGRVDAVVALSAGYGTAIKQRWGTSAPEQVDGLAVPLLIVHGTDDTQNAGTQIDTVRAYEKAARDKGKKVTTVYVAGGTHLFPFYADQGWTDEVRGKVAAFIKG